MTGRRQLIGLAVLVSMVASSASSFADINDDCIEANDKSIALRKAGKLLEARAETTKCAIAACGEDMQSSCLKRTDDINAALPSIVFDVRDEAGADVEGVKVSIDGKPSDNATAVAISLDPGEHKVVFEVTGQPPLEKSFILREGDHQRRERISFARPHEGPSATPRPETPPPAEAPSPGRTQRIVGLSSAGVGVVGLVLGAVFGLSASSKWSDAQKQCGSGCAPSDPAQGLRNDASSAATLSTVSFVAGGVLLAGGLALVLTAPKSSAPTSSTAGALRLAPTTGPRNGGVSLAGTF